MQRQAHGKWIGRVGNVLAPPLSSEGAFQKATGKGIRVAVIDSGVNAAHPHVNGVAGGTAIGGELDSYLDLLGHGTAVLAAIKEKAPDAEYYAVKVYYRSLRTTLHRLAQAFQWAIDHRMDVMNLSLGTVNPAHHDCMNGLVQAAEKAGIVVVAAAEADSVPALPGCLPGVIGVAVEWTCPREAFQFDPAHPRPRWLASGYPRTLPGLSPARNLYGVSFAVANMSGFVVRACQMSKAEPDMTIDRILHRESTPIALTCESSKRS